MTPGYFEYGSEKMEALTWDEFKSNVEGWSEARGIYAHSTALAQALKAASEAGELCDAIIKGDRDALEDAIGDVAVCLVNVAYITASQLDYDYIFDDVNEVAIDAHQCVAHAVYAVGSVCLSAAKRNIAEPMVGVLDEAFYSLYATAKASSLDFLDCCEAAWNEIKDRKGRMVAGGAFVKEGAQ